MTPPDPLTWDGPHGRERSEVRCTACGEGGIAAGTADLHLARCDG